MNPKFWNENFNSHPSLATTSITMVEIPLLVNHVETLPAGSKSSGRFNRVAFTYSIA
jgi:hypothetical protein